MGYSEKEIDEKLPAILEFADIGDYVYQPCKTYSSGMFVRLAFAVAINIEPEILIVDEDGFRHVEEVIVDEEMAGEQPVWVVNRNSDAGYTTLELLRREDPNWGEGGGTIIIKPSSLSEADSGSSGLFTVSKTSTLSSG